MRNRGGPRSWCRSAAALPARQTNDARVKALRVATSPERVEPDHSQLVARAQAGELAAFEALATRHERRVYALAWRMPRRDQDAEEITQQTLLSAIEHLGGFRGDASFSTWLLRIATHSALKVIRKRKSLPTVSL